MAELKMPAGILGSREDELELALAAALLPDEWRVTIVRSSALELLLTVEMQGRRTTRSFPPRSTDAIVEYLQRAGREFGSKP
jgi:hypothetical protein